MRKIKILLEKNYDEFIALVEDFYSKNHPTRKSKTHCTVYVGDKIYNNNNFQETYIQFLMDFNKFLSDDTLLKILGKSCTFSLKDVNVKAKDQGYFLLLDKRFFINVKTNTSTKIRHIKNIANYLNLEIDMVEEVPDKCLPHQ